MESCCAPAYPTGGYWSDNQSQSSAQTVFSRQRTTSAASTIGSHLGSRKTQTLLQAPIPTQLYTEKECIEIYKESVKVLESKSPLDIFGLLNYHAGKLISIHWSIKILEKLQETFHGQKDVLQVNSHLSNWSVTIVFKTKPFRFQIHSS